MLELELLPVPAPSSLLGFCGTGAGAGSVPVPVSFIQVTVTSPVNGYKTHRFRIGIFFMLDYCLSSAKATFCKENIL